MIYTYTLTPVAPYRFQYFKERVETSSNSYLYRISDDQIARAHILGGDTVLVRVRAEQPDSPDAAPLLHLTVEGAPAQDVADRVAAVWRHMLSADRDLAPFYNAVAHDDILRGLTERYQGMHLLLDSDPFEAMILAIIGQQVNLSFAESLKKSLVELCGRHITVGGETFVAFPGPEEIARLTADDLRAHKYSQRKAEYVVDFARGVAEGSVDLVALEAMSNEEAIQYLVKLRGVGRWSAECVLMNGLGRPDLLPAADIGLRNAIRHFYGWEHQPTEQEVRDFAADWKGCESYATYYLWTALGAEKAVAAAQKKRKSTPTGKSFHS